MRSGSNFLVLAMIGFMMASCGHHETNQNDTFTKTSNSSKTKTKIESDTSISNKKCVNYLEDDFCYQFMNEAILLTPDTIPESSWLKLEYQLQPQSAYNWKEFIDYLKGNRTLSEEDPLFNLVVNWDKAISILQPYLKPGDKPFMLEQIDSSVLIWNCDRLNTVICPDTNVVDSIFSLPDKPIQSKEVLAFKDPWSIFRQVYGNYGLHSYSKPIYNQNRTIVIIEHSGVGGYTMGSGEIYIFKRDNSKWELIYELDLWIS